MSALMLDYFDYTRIPVDDEVESSVAVAGSGPALVLLHGFPQTHYMWRDVARELMSRFTVIVPDLRGYGASSKPAERDATTYSKRSMARDVVRVTESLGFERFGLVGHDRGALVGVRAALDHPSTVQYLGILDVLPTADTWEVLRGIDAKVAWHLYLMAQPAGLPEKMIGAVAAEFFGSFLDAWDPDGSTFSAAVREHYIESSVGAVDSIVADYRATAGIDLEMDLQDRAAGLQLSMPVGVISQDWGSQLGFDASSLWRAWAPDSTYEPIDAGHFMAEEKPDAIAEFITRLSQRSQISAGGQANGHVLPVNSGHTRGRYS
ncbi:alpha/beta hydrolase [Rhodococcus fascians]|nr:alpha/beta hydrolase [Rhodococcus fascians]MBY4238876.1 alpha/beta hydrolase [Rhodococcus fascians]MBY4255383.1 alpha/beta hydrolase [Rhodococcus fascians]MBY4270231.1 alpha/beta hydrolase [Rhodococcus fascians]